MQAIIFKLFKKTSQRQVHYTGNENQVQHTHFCSCSCEFFFCEQQGKKQSKAEVG